MLLKTSEHYFICVPSYYYKSCQYTSSIFKENSVDGYIRRCNHYEHRQYTLPENIMCAWSVWCGQRTASVHAPHPKKMILNCLNCAPSLKTTERACVQDPSSYTSAPFYFTFSLWERGCVDIQSCYTTSNRLIPPFTSPSSQTTWLDRGCEDEVSGVASKPSLHQRPHPRPHLQYIILLVLIVYPVCRLRSEYSSKTPPLSQVHRFFKTVHFESAGFCIYCVAT